jgi:hypothetical protein
LPQYRGKGLARQLLDKAESVAGDSGTNRIALQVEEVNEIAFNTYQRNGYVEVDRRPYIPFPGTDDTGDYVFDVEGTNANSVQFLPHQHIVTGIVRAREGYIWPTVYFDIPISLIRVKCDLVYLFNL